MSSDENFNLENILREISSIENNINLTESFRTVSITESQTPTSDIIVAMAVETNAVQHKFTPWDGTPDQYSLCSIMWRVAAEDPAVVKGYGGERGVCLALMQTLPAIHRSRVGPFFERQVKSGEFYSSLLLDEFDRHFTDRDREARNRRLLYSVKQGKAQPFAKFLHIFEGYLSNAGELAPTGVSRIHTLSEAIAPYLRQAAANQTALERLDYNRYVEQLSTLATNWESLPEFHTRHNEERSETYTESAIGDLPLNIQEQLRQQIAIQAQSQSQQFQSKPQLQSANPQPPTYDRDGDIKMSGTDISLIVSTVISALNNSTKPKRNGQPRALDTRPNAPHCSEEEQNSRLKSGRCIRCNTFPSHRYRDCKFKGFRSDPSTKLAIVSTNEPEN
ncbi:hypothetical protein EV44_g3652 [Erysiphe necator]|uniref:Uncharacterized protein n=1 Tax=Uncinula necator TaxID=52586 RepID=A0A0B1NUI1_UNCNE|nr:hypothetical protein EV44_g3652 [Erysiphe necator]